ncbi:MAG: hypothetical protein HY816_04460 [Candidatus Wallbacteria bacterium]|nr:hypothetical protein [Candidatus Wallbacteria bacterium]
MRALRARETGGVGLPLLVVLTLLVLLAFLGFHQLYFASHVQAGSVRGAWGDVALAIAESAVEELMHRVKSDASDPSRPLYHELRKEVLAGQMGAMPIPDSTRLDVAPRLLEQAPAPGAKIDWSSAEVGYQRQFEENPWERFGLIRYRARVSVDGSPGPRLVRELEVAQGFKVVSATVPRPFDQAAVYVGDLWSLTDPADVNRRRERYLAAVERHREWLDQAMARAPVQLAERYSEARSAIPSGSELAGRVPLLPVTRPALLVASGHQGQEFPLDALDLARKLAAEEVGAAASEARVQRTLAALDAAPASASAHEALLSALAESLELLQGLMSRIWAFGEGYRVVGVEQPEYQALVRRHAGLWLDHWRRVAGFVLREEGGQTVQSRFDSLARRLGTLNGVVLCESPGGTMTLTGNLPGKLVLVVSGGHVVLDGTNGQARPQDLLTVVVLGGTVEVRGEVHAALVLASLPGEAAAGPPDSKALFAPGAVLRGGLVIERLGAGSVLAGSLFREEKYSSGPAGRGALADRYAVLVSPLAVYRKVAHR